MNNSIDSPGSLPTPLSIDNHGFKFLEETRKWGHFLSVMGFIGLGLVVIIGLFMGVFLDTFSGGQIPSGMPVKYISLVYIIVACIYFFPIYYLNRFAAHMKSALHEMNQESLNTSFQNLKSLFRFMGIVTVIVLSIYIIVIASALIFGVYRSF